MPNGAEGFAGASWLSVKIGDTINGKGLTPFRTPQYLKVNTEKLHNAPLLQKDVTDDFSRGSLICYSY